MSTGRTAGIALAVGGTLVWLLALLGGAVGNPTVWAVVGVGVGVFLVSSAVREGGAGPVTVSPRARTVLLAGLAIATALALWALVAAGGGPALFVLGGLVGIVLWIASSVAVAASRP